MAFEWTDKVDGVDDVLADDINSIAHEVQKNADDINSIAHEVQKNKGENEIVISPYRVEEFDEEDEKALQRADYILDPVSPNRNVEIINEAIQQLRHEDGTTGGEIVFFGGYVPITSGIIIDLDNVKISGNGVIWDLYYPNESENFVTVSGENVTISDIKITTETVDVNSGFNGSNFFSISGRCCNIENCIFNTTNTGGYLFDVTNAPFFHAKNCVHRNFDGMGWNGFRIGASNAFIEHCDIYTYDTPLYVSGSYCTLLSNAFSGFIACECTGQNLRAFSNKFESRDFDSCFDCSGNGAMFFGNEFSDFYGYEFESSHLLSVSSNSIIVGNSFVHNYSSTEYPNLVINGDNNIYSGNIIDSIQDNGENNITYLTSADKTTINNTLESESETEALSANMGRELNSRISSLESSISGIETILADANAVADSYIEGGTA